jgi:hypothetical protein
MNAQDRVRKVMAVSPSIRVATVCDMSGKYLHSARRKVVKNKLSPTESKKALKAAAAMWKERNSLTRKLGKGKYVLAEYEKIKRITMPVGKNQLLYLTTSPAADHNKIIQAVRRFK